jgi:hypothetical protein
VKRKYDPDNLRMNQNIEPACEDTPNNRLQRTAFRRR